LFYNKKRIKDNINKLVKIKNLTQKETVKKQKNKKKNGG